MGATVPGRSYQPQRHQHCFQIFASRLEVFGILFVFFSLSLDFGFRVAPAVPNAHSGWPDIIVLGTFSVIFFPNKALAAEGFLLIF